MEQQLAKAGACWVVQLDPSGREVQRSFWDGSLKIVLEAWSNYTLARWELQDANGVVLAYDDISPRRRPSMCWGDTITVELTIS